MRNRTALSSKIRNRRSRSTRRLFAETLENRLLLTTVTSVEPPADAIGAPVTSDVSATFDLDVNAATATPQNFILHSKSQGRLVGAATTVTASGPTITHNPTANFPPGQLVEATITSGVTTTGGAANPYVWRFRTEVTSGSAQFVDSGQVLGSNEGRQISFGDVDGDGDLDAVNGGELVWLNDGAGVFTDSGQSMTAGNESELADVDGDGDLDLVGNVQVWLNDGSGIFGNSGQALGGGATLETGDVDGDGDIDVMLGVRYAPNQLWLNDGSGQFTNSGQVLDAFNTDGLEFGDFDGDGDLDAFAANVGGNNKIWVNDGSGNFTDSGQNLGGFRSSYDVDTGDIDGDGDLDAIVGNEYDNIGVRIWVNDGNGTFFDSGQSIASDGNSRPTGARLGDLDGDGDLDIWAANRRDPSQIWLNDGAGGFSDSGQRLTFTFADRRIDNVALADVDGDGDLDAWEANIFIGGSKLWINQNLTPSVSLAVDNASVAEAAGVSTVTATLSAASTDPVTIDLGISGTATATDDFIISATQIVIAAGATSGTATITAVQDSVDEPDETVVVDITAATNAQEAGTQQVTVTIQDDDEPIPVPDVTLIVDNAAIAEAAGVATFTANLSVPTTVPVTIDFGISGTAAASDFTASGTQIVVAPGATSGTITITAVQDEVDEPDETVVVDITNVTGGTEQGAQQQTTTITDDDEPPVPDVTLTVDQATIAEAAGVAVFTITLSEATTVPVTVDLAISGTAAASDYTATATQVTIAPGATSGTLAVTAVQDEVNEPDETVIVDIASVAGGNEVGDQQQTTTILDDDVPPSFAVTSLVGNASGFHAEFTNPLDASALNLYDTQNAGLGASDVVVTGATNGPIAGSLVTGDSSITFISSGGPLLPDTYTVTLRSAADGFKDSTAMLLDGNGDGTGGDNYVGSFTVDESAAANRSLHIPDFVRGPGQDVNLPADGTTGIPVSISDGTDVRAVDLRISYDPNLLEITGASAPAGGTVVLNSNTPGLAILVYFNTAPLPAGESTFINLQATVPTANASAIYGEQQILDLHGAIVGDGNDNEFPVVVDDALHFATYFADVSGNGRINASDAAQVARFAALIDSGFAASLNTDPIIVGDISGNGRLNAADASRVAQFAALIPVPEIPPVPAGIVINGIVPDVRLLEPTEEDELSALPVQQLPEALDFGVVDHFSSAAVDQVMADLDERQEDDDSEEVASDLADSLGLGETL